MSKRFLFVVPPLAGHVNPTLAVAAALRTRGHQVAWVAHPRRVRPLLPEDAELIALDDGVSDDVWRPILERARNVRGLESYQFLWEEVLVPLARGMRPGVEAAIATYRPDVVVVDHQAIGGALACRRLGARWATFCTTSASIINPFGDLPKIDEWTQAKLRGLEAEADLPAVAEPDLSPELVVVFSTKELVGEDAFPLHYRFVGPSLGRAETASFPMDALRDLPRVLVSLGTVSAEVGEKFFATVVAAFADAPLQIVLVAPPALVPGAPENFIVQARVPQLALMPKLAAVVCHAGHNTVCEALAHGVPLVVTPIRDDQPVVAAQVVKANAGIRLKYGRLTPALLRDATARVLGEPSFRQAAQRIAKSFSDAGGASAAANHLENLA